VTVALPFILYTSKKAFNFYFVMFAEVYQKIGFKSMTATADISKTNGAHYIQIEVNLTLEKRCFVYKTKIL
jgi:hypothetical protein